MSNFAIRCGTAALALLWVSIGLAQELNSERIQRLFGSYGVDIVHQTGGTRVSNLYSLDDDRPVSRTLAIVRFEDPLPAELQTVHGEILGGASLGATLKRAGWTINKDNIYIGSMDVPATSGVARLMALRGSGSLALHVYRLSVHNGGPVSVYATIVELHHPELHSETTLADVFGKVTANTDQDALREHYAALVLSALPP